MKDKKVLFLLPTLDTGGGERIASELSLHLPQDIQRVIVLFENKVSYPYKGKLISLHIPFSKNFFPKFYYFFKSFLRVKKIIDEEKPDYVMSFGNMPHIINILTGKNPIVRNDNSLSKGYQGFWGQLFKILVRFLFNKSLKIIVVSKGIENDLIKNFGIKKEKTKLIYNPIDIQKIQNSLSESLKPEHQEIFKYPVIISIGRLSEQKGQWHLIRAFQEVKKREKDLKLVILGKGELESYLKGLIKDLNLENDVHLLGWQENPFKFLARSKLFVLPSLWEGLGIVILEAMACGVPVISSDCQSGPRDILAPNTDAVFQTKEVEYADYGILVPVCDGKLYNAGGPLTREEKVLAEAIIKLFTDKGLSAKLVAKSKEHAAEFDIKKIIKEYQFLYNT